jgi:hypothetical protein
MKTTSIRSLALFLYTVLVTLFLALLPSAQAQTTIVTNTFGLPFGAIAAGGQSNITGQAAGSAFTAGTAVTLRNSPLGVDITFRGSTATNATPQFGLGFQTSSDNLYWSQNLLWLIVPGNRSCPTNVYERTNFTQAVLGNARYLRIATATNGPGTSFTVSGVQAHYWY